MIKPVQVRVAASPRLLHDVVAQSLQGDGIEITESETSLVTVTTPDHTHNAHSEIVIVLGESTAGDVHVLVNGIHVQDRALDASQLHRLVLELAESVRDDSPTVCAPRAPQPPSTDAEDGREATPRR